MLDDLKITLAADFPFRPGAWIPVAALSAQFVDDSLCEFARFVDQIQIRRIPDVCRRASRIH